MKLTEPVIAFLNKTAAAIKGSVRRAFMADTVEQLGYGGQTMAEVKLGWARTTIRLGQREKQSGIQCIPAYNMRGRKPVEFHLPNLLKDIKEIVDEFSQTDPQFRNKRLYTRLTVKELRHQLITYKGYSSESLPGNETLRLRMNKLGFILKKVEKSKPLKKIPETNAIFAQLAIDNKIADADETVLRISMDAKAVVKMGELSRGRSQVSCRIKVEKSVYFSGFLTSVFLGLSGLRWTSSTRFQLRMFFDQRNGFFWRASL